MIYLNDSNFEQEIQNSKVPVLVDFFAEWCGPCKMLAPIFEEVAKGYEGKCKLVKVNVEECPTISAKFRVMSIPTLIFFKNGEKVNSTMGAMSKDQLIDFIETNI